MRKTKLDVDCVLSEAHDRFIAIDSANSDELHDAIDNRNFRIRSILNRLCAISL